MAIYNCILAVFWIELLCSVTSPVQSGQTNRLCQPTKHQDSRDDFLNHFKVRDGLEITWLHAVNSPDKLKDGMSSDIMMFEADVLMRNNQVYLYFEATTAQGTKQVSGTPVMAHPPDVDSNFTLAEFLNQTIGSTKGIKLDFKTVMVVEPSLRMIQNVTSGKEVNTPIWLNADILPGPFYDKVCTPVDHVRFVSLCTGYFPQATLSISWTTGKNMTLPQNFYNWTQVIPMGKLVSQISQPITFPVRAVLVQRSSQQIHWLLDLSKTFTITIWSSKYDTLDVQDLVKLRRVVSDVRRIYYDLPPAQDKAFKEALKSEHSEGSYNNRGSGESFLWKAAAEKRCEDVLVGHSSVMFSGDGGEVLSEKALHKVYAFYHLFVSGTCSFINTAGSNEKGSISISLHVTNTTGSPTSNPGKIVRLVLHSNGVFQLSLNGGETKDGSVRSETGAYKFSIVESSRDGKQRTFKCRITTQDSKGEDTSVSLTVESGPMAGHLLISAGKQPVAVLVENVEIVLAAEQTSGASDWKISENCCLQNIIVSGLLALFLSLCQM